MRKPIVYLQFLRVKKRSRWAKRLEQVNNILDSRAAVEIIRLVPSKRQIYSYPLMMRLKTTQAATVLFPVIFISWTIGFFVFILNIDANNKKTINALQQ